MLAILVEVLSKREEVLDHVLAVVVGLLSASDLIPPIKESMALHGSVDLLLMFFPLCLEQLISFELCVDMSNFLLFVDFFLLQFAVFHNDCFVLPGPPDLIL